jgi:hypothetical protein
MKKFLAVLGVIFLVLILIVLGGVGVGFLLLRGNPADAIGIRLLAPRTVTFDNEGKAYADAVIPAIAANWNVKELLDRESPEFRQTVTQQQIDQTFQRAAGLGHLQKCEPAQGKTMISITTKAKEIKGDYTAKATFDKGEAIVGLSIIKHDDQWQIQGLFVNPLVPQATPQPQPQPHSQ